MATIELTMRHTRHEGTGLSSDTKPSGNYDDRIYETDTGDEYKCFGGENWKKISTAGALRTVDGSGSLVSLGYEQLTGFTSAKTLAEAGATIPAGATIAYIQAESQNVRYTKNGPAPTATTGVRLLAGVGDYFGNLDTLEFFQEAATAKLNVEYY